VRNGVLFGLVLGVVYLIIYALVGVLHILAASSIVSIAFTLLIFVAAGVAGARAAGVNGKVTSGLLAGLFTALLGAALGTVGAIIFDYLNADALVRIANRAYAAAGLSLRVSPQTFLVNTVLGSLVIIVVDALIGLGIGALGGLIGRGRAPKAAAATYQESFYPGAAAPMGGAPFPPANEYPQAPPPAGGYPPTPPQQ